MDYSAIASKKFPVGVEIDGPVPLVIGAADIQFENRFVSMREVVFNNAATGKFHQARSVVVMPDCMLIVPVLSNGNIVMVRIFRPGIGSWNWEMPQERMEEDATIEEAAARCAREELGLLGEPSFVRVLSPVATMPDRVTEITHPVVVRGEFHYNSRSDKKEVVDGCIGEFTPAQVERMIGDGDIMCPCAISSFFKYWSWLKG